MAKAPWTYEVPPWRSDPKGLDKYQVKTSDGQRVGTVATTVRHDGQVYVVVEGGTPPITNEHHAVRWEEVEAVDHRAHLVHLSLDVDGVRDALELDPANRVDGPDAARADARRVAELPESLRPSAAPSEPGPIQRPLHVITIALGLLGAFSLLLAVIVLEQTDTAWGFALLVLPVAFFAAALLAGYQLLRQPHRRDVERDPLPVDPAEPPRERRDARPPA